MAVEEAGESAWLYIAALCIEIFWASDADAPLTDDEFERGRTAMLAPQSRFATGLSQQDFAKRFGIPVASLRDWKHGRRTPDRAAQSYLRVIAKNA